jgi:predicted secreted protein
VGIVLSVLLLFDLLTLCCLSFFFLIFWHVLSVLLLFANRSNRRRTDNTMPKDQIEEGQTTQCPQIK